MFLSYRVDELTFEKKLVRMDADMYKKLYETEKQYTEMYWSHYLEEQRKNRSKAILIKELNEEIAELEELLAHKELELDNANDWATGFEEAYERVKEENQHLEELLSHETDTIYDMQEYLDKLAEKNESYKTELKYYREKYEGDYDPIE